MIKIDAGSKLERKISHDVFCAYISTNDIVEFNKKVVELSNETGLDECYLKRLREVYYRNYASPTEIAMHDEKAAFYRKRAPRYMLICDEVFEISDNERVKYMYSKHVNSYYVREYLQKYKKNGGKYSNLVDDFYDQYISFVETRNSNNIEEKKDNYFYEGCSFYDELVDLGFYNVQNYLRYVFDNSRDYRKLESKFITYRKKISEFNTELMDYYVISMEKNREKTFYLMKDRIDYFMERVINTVQGFDNVDIIDYYMIIGMPLDDFKKLCKNFINISSFNIIFNAYFKMEQGLVDDPKIDCNYVFNGESVTLNDKNKVLNFLYQNNIPYVYFNVALKKYCDGGLDQYFVSEKQKTLSNK